MARLWKAMRDMKRARNGFSWLAGSVLLMALSVLPASAQEGFKPPCPPQKDLCALMIRYGDQAYDRERYLEAKKYYRMAIAADPASAKAWALYDRAFLADMAQQVERTGKFIPYVPQGDLEKMAAPQPTPPAAAVKPEPPRRRAPPLPGTGEKPKEALPSGVIIREDEGC